jgi:cytochrome c oxidase subunit IV
MSAHVESLKNYLIIFFLLMAMLVATVFAASFDLDHIYPGLNLVVAMAIAIVKALLVVMFFMHLRHSSGLTWTFAFAAFLWLGIMMTLTSADYLARAETSASISVPPTAQEHASLVHMAPGGAEEAPGAQPVQSPANN